MALSHPALKIEGWGQQAEQPHPGAIAVPPHSSVPGCTGDTPHALVPQGWVKSAERLEAACEETRERPPQSSPLKGLLSHTFQRIPSAAFSNVLTFEVFSRFK